MATPILATKLYIPSPRSKVVSRPNLIERLDEGLDCKLTLISAPAGFGKTTLLSEWIAASDYPVAWLSLDESESDHKQFLAYLIVALRTIAPTIGEGFLGALNSPQPPPAESILPVLVNDITAVPRSFVLVLDDYHVIDSPAIDSALAFLLDHLPPQMHLVIATREDPLLPLARLRARGQLTEIRITDLRFSVAEAAEFLNNVMGLDLPDEDIDALANRTEGWITGLQLAALSMRGHADAAGFIRSFTGSNRFVLDYLIEEVLEQQPTSLQSFLLHTAVVSKLTGSLCDALTGQDNSRETLEELERANLFIIPLDGERRWYRYHHLFADLLRRRLRQTEMEQVPVLHLRASEWYAQHGFIDEAIDHAFNVPDYERAAELIADYVDDIWQFGEHTKLRRWLDALPATVVLARPHLCILHAAILYSSGQIELAEKRLRAAERALEVAALPAGEPPDPQTRKLRGRTAVVRAHLVSYHGDMQAAIQDVQLALANLPESDATWRWSAFDCIGTVYSAVDEPSAYQARLEALEASKATGNIYMILYASLRLVVTLRDLGHLQEAAAICEQQLKLAQENGLAQTALVGWLYTLWGEILAEKNELDTALQLANRGIELTERGQDVILLGSSYLCLMRVLFSRGDMAGADEAAQTISLKQDISPWISIQMAAWQARIYLAQGRLDLAALWAERSALDLEAELAPIHDYDYYVLARLLTAQGRLDEAANLLQRLFEAATAGGRTSKLIEILALQALVFAARGDTEQALTTLGQALLLAEPGGFIRTFTDEGPPMARLLGGALTRGTVPNYGLQVLAAFPAPEPQRVTLEPAQDEPLEPLSEREIEVLQLIAEGLSNPQIAARLFLALNTVKAHTRTIYSKLGVHNRTQAVVRARSLGILPPV